MGLRLSLIFELMFMLIHNLISRLPLFSCCFVYAFRSNNGILIWDQIASIHSIISYIADCQR